MWHGHLHGVPGHNQRRNAMPELPKALRKWNDVVRMSEARHKTDVLVVGAGPAGIAAACTAASTGRRVTLVDDTPWLGGQIWRGEQARPRNAQAAKWISRLRNSGAQLLDRTSIIAAPGLGLLLGERNEAPMEFEWNKLIIATGARELFLPFPGWTLPGVMGPGGLLSLVKNGWPISGKTVAIAGSGPLLLATAAGLQHYGAKVISISEQAPFSRLCSFSLQVGFLSFEDAPGSRSEIIIVKNTLSYELLADES